ncbi:MAG TPA: helix-hairpin-helix domain-containing protein [Chthonomonadaceae bacterium]|nr:helix-hairpin-helix domain-containing protein [Chthonomonadaceae bacterium]
MMDRRAIGIGVFVALVAGVVSLKALSGPGGSPGIPVTQPQPPGRGAPYTQRDAAAHRAGATVPAPRSTAEPESGQRPPAGDRSAAGGGAGANGAGADAPAAGSAGQPSRSAGDPVASSGASSTPDILIHVAGAVKRPGVYHLQAGARNDDAVKAAGGLASWANGASVNLAARAIDGAQLYVKSVKEQPEGGAGEAGIAAVSTGPKSGAVHGARTAASGRAAAGGRSAKLKDPSEGRININTASAEELQRIPHVGPAMAEKVIAYREANHGFQSAEDLMQVKGIGAKTYNKMAPFVRIR